MINSLPPYETSEPPELMLDRIPNDDRTQGWTLEEKGEFCVYKDQIGNLCHASLYIRSLKT